eukprot:scaffold27881_cov54-Phaeocystis_antarctica.AAC.2
MSSASRYAPSKPTNASPLNGRLSVPNMHVTPHISPMSEVLVNGEGADQLNPSTANPAANASAVALQTLAAPPIEAQQVLSTVVHSPEPNAVDSEANALGTSGPPNSDGRPKYEPDVEGVAQAVREKWHRPVRVASREASRRVEGLVKQDVRTASHLVGFCVWVHVGALRDVCVGAVHAWRLSVPMAVPVGCRNADRTRAGYRPTPSAHLKTSTADSP